MELIANLLLISFLSGALCLLLPRKNDFFVKTIAVTASAVCLLLAYMVFLMPIANYQFLSYELFKIDNLNKFIVLAIGVFGFLVVLYSLKYFKAGSRMNIYYACILGSLSASFGAILSNNFILLLVFWGFLGFTLYMLIQTYPSGNAAAKKTFIIIGGTDCFMILGIAIIFFLSGTMQIDKIHLSTLNSKLSIIAFLCLAFAAFAKAGAMPFHTWIPDMAEVSPSPVIAFLPASLDKLLGIYLLARISLNVFTLTPGLSMLLMLIGVFTIIAAVFMAMIQHDLKRLLSYHAVSQVGYMVLGIGTGNPIGIAGGIFHMLNHAIYKSCLFLCGGSVEQKTGTTDLDKLGGLASRGSMPITFITFVIASLSISGVPPFNGFVSKWMIYQGLIEKLMISGGRLAVVLILVAAMFGSALTLASFMKLIHAIFFAQKPQTAQTGTGDVSWQMWIPQAVLALLCAVFGVFAFGFPLKYFIFPALAALNIPGVTAGLPGLWQPGLASLLIISCLIAGGLIYLLSNALGSKIRREKAFIGGESLPEEVRVTGVDFYQTIQDITILKKIYALAQKKVFDIYDVGKSVVIAIARVFSEIHTGNMHIYLAWSVLGIIVLFFIITGH
ncbi:MAG: hypothetical protein KKH91_02285 [Elusimicrobia bacterium]|nr:hypothetical protein [Elusimicrobiota bacterium]MBU2614414.1 hypothetical protein [Elusimicrobiota bacterium]